MHSLLLYTPHGPWCSFTNRRTTPPCEPRISQTEDSFNIFLCLSSPHLPYRFSRYFVPPPNAPRRDQSYPIYLSVLLTTGYHFTSKQQICIVSIGMANSAVILPEDSKTDLQNVSNTARFYTLPSLENWTNIRKAKLSLVNMYLQVHS